MITKPEPEKQADSKPISSLGVLGARLTWVILGPMALLGLTWGIASRRAGWLTGLDAAFGIVLALMLLGRWVEHRSGTGTTLTGEFATPEQFKRYMAYLPPLAVVAWIVAHIVGTYVLK